MPESPRNPDSVEPTLTPATQPAPTPLIEKPVVKIETPKDKAAVNAENRLSDIGVPIGFSSKRSRFVDNPCEPFLAPRGLLEFADFIVSDWAGKLAKQRLLVLQSFDEYALHSAAWRVSQHHEFSGHQPYSYDDFRSRQIHLQRFPNLTSANSASSQLLASDASLAISVESLARSTLSPNESRFVVVFALDWPAEHFIASIPEGYGLSSIGLPLESLKGQSMLVLTTPSLLKKVGKESCLLVEKPIDYLPLWIADERLLTKARAIAADKWSSDEGAFAKKVAYEVSQNGLESWIQSFNTASPAAASEMPPEDALLENAVLFTAVYFDEGSESDKQSLVTNEFERVLFKIIGDESLEPSSTASRLDADVSLSQKIPLSAIWRKNRVNGLKQLHLVVAQRHFEFESAQLRRSVRACFETTHCFVFDDLFRRVCESGLFWDQNPAISTSVLRLAIDVAKRLPEKDFLYGLLRELATNGSMDSGNETAEEVWTALREMPSERYAVLMAGAAGALERIESSSQAVDCLNRLFDAQCHWEVFLLVQQLKKSILFRQLYSKFLKRIVFESSEQVRFAAKRSFVSTFSAEDVDLLLEMGDWMKTNSDSSTVAVQWVASVIMELVQGLLYRYEADDPLSVSSDPIMRGIISPNGQKLVEFLVDCLFHPAIHTVAGDLNGDGESRVLEQVVNGLRCWCIPNKMTSAEAQIIEAVRRWFDGYEHELGEDGIVRVRQQPEELLLAAVLGSWATGLELLCESKTLNAEFKYPLMARNKARLQQYRHIAFHWGAMDSAFLDSLDYISGLASSTGTGLARQRFLAMRKGIRSTLRHFPVVNAADRSGGSNNA